MTGCGPSGGLRRVSRHSKALGAAVTMTVLHEEESIAQTAVEAAFAGVERVEAVMSLYRPESQISRLNRDGVLHSPDAYLIEVLRQALQVSELSDGAFDITVQPLWQLHWKGDAPNAEAIEKVRSRVGWRQVKIEPDRVSLEPGAAITLNAIAQGFAADAALRVIREHGVRHALIDTGEFAAMGRNAKGLPWRIGIQHPRKRDAFAAVTHLEDRCLSTSGDYETAFSEDFSAHHIFDPRSGLSPLELASVSVLAPTAMLADALSTTLFVLGEKRGIDFLRHYPGTDALLIFKDGRQVPTPGFTLVG